MVSKNNLKNKMEQTAARTPHYGIRKLSVGVASVLISTTLYMGATTAKADTLPSTATDAATTNPETASSSSSTQTNVTADNTAKTTVPTTASFTDTSVSTTSNAQASTTDTTAGATSSDKSSVNNNSLVTNNVESTANTTAQTQPKPDVVTSDKANVDNQVGSSVENVVNASWTLKYVDKNNHDKEILPSTNIKLQFARNLNADQKTYGDWYIVDNSLSQTGTNLKVLSLEKTANDTTEDGFNRDNFSIKVQLPNSPSENYRKEYGTFTFTWGVLNDRDKNSTMENTSFVDYPEQKKITITYVDDDRDGEVITKKSLTGDIGTEVKTLITDYSGYALNGDYPQTITMTNDTKDIIVHMKHKTETIKVILDVQLLLKKILLLDNDKSNIAIATNDEFKEHNFNSHLSYGKIPFNITLDLSTSLVASVSPTDGFDISQLSKPFTLPQGSTDDFHFALIGGKSLSQVLADYVKEGKLDKSYLDNPIKIYVSYKGTISNANISNHDTFKKDNNIFYNNDGSLKDNYLSSIITNGEKLGDKVIDKVTIPNSVFTPENIKDLLNNYHYNLPIIGFEDEAPLYIPFEVDYVPYAEKQVSRTINIKNPDGTTKKIVQTATIDRKVIFNGEGNADWSTASFERYDVPVVDGYTASQGKVDEVTVNGDTTNQVVNITYTANKQSTTVKYIDKDGKVVHETQISGKTDETVNVPNELPNGWKLIDESSLPKTITFRSNGNVPITVQIGHATIDVQPDQPKTSTDKMPNGENYPSGVGQSDLNKTVTRTIKITDSQGKVTTETQTVHLTRTATVDEVTGKVTYSDWSTGKWNSYSVPTVEGYTATQSKVDEVNVASDTQNSEVNISYTANTEKEVVNGSWTFKYTDKETGEEIMPATTIHAQFTRTNTPATNTFGDWSYVKGSFSQTGTHVDVQDPTKENDVTNHSDIMDTFKFSVPMPEDPSDKYQQIYGTSDVTFELYNDNRQAPTLDKTLIIPYKHKIIYKETTVEIPLNYEFQILLPEATHLIVAPTKDHLNGRRLDNVAYTVKQTIEGEAPYDKVTGTFDYTKFSIYDRRRLVIPGRSLPQNIDNYYIVKAIGETTESNQYVGLTVQELLTKLQAHNYFALPTWETYLPLTSDDTQLSFVTKEEQGITKAVAYNDLPIHSSAIVFDPRIGIETLAEDDNPFATFYYTITKEETKTVTRTIELQLPMKPTQAIKQTAILTRDQYQATNEPYNKDQWSKYATAWHDSEWSAYTVPTVDGYTASQNEILVTKVTDTTKDQTIRVTYTANPQSIKINYVDDEKGGATVKSDTLNGKTDETVKTGITIPENYSVVGTTPSEYTFKSSGNTDITVHLKHVIDTTSEEKTITRTIKVTDPTGKVTTIPQTAKVTRTVSTDKVTNQKTYSDWTTSSFDSYDVPTIEGYTASQSTVDEAIVDGNSKDSEVNISYTANDQAIKINYVDSDNNGSVVKSDTLTGKTDQTVKTGIEVPDGYVIDGNVLTDYTFKSRDNADVTVKLKHGTTTVTPDKPKTTNDKLPDNPSKAYPEGVAENDLNKTVTRTINVTTPDGKTSTTTQTVHLTRTATVDEVTGEVVYSKWSTGSFDNYDAPVVEGYTPSQDRINEARVTSDSTNSEVNVTYTPNGQSINITYVDDDNGGATVDSYILAGKTDETIATGIEIPTGYIANSEVPSEYSFKANGNTDITVHLKHEIKTDADYKNVLRTIKVTLPNGKSESLVQVATLSREVKTDKVINNVSYGSWSSDKFTSYKLPSIEGYIPSLDVVNEAKVDGNTEDSTVEVNYTANKQSAKVVYVDNGKVVATQTLAGKTDQTVKTNIQSPDKDKYVVVGDNPESYTFKAKDNVDIKVEVKHVINDSTESKNITRTIVVTRPDGKKTTEVQKVTVSRTVHTDAVTGAKTYDEWSKATLDKYDVPVIDGYTPSLNVVEGLEVDGDSEDSVVKVGYTANDQTAKIVYVDGDNGGSTVKTDILNGKTDETVKTGIKIPEGYVVSGNVLTDYTFKSKDNADITVKLKHGTTTVTPDKPKTTNDKLPDNPSKAYPEGVSENDLNKVVTRTIKITTPDGKTSVTTQTVHLTRTATVDEVTGEVTYSDWSTGKWDNYKIPAIEGYDSNVDQVDGQEVTFDTKNQTVEVSYTKLADSDGSTTPVKEENNTETPKQSQDKVQSKFVDTELPQTGEKDNKKVSALGAVIASLAAGLGLAGIRRKKDKN